jgi:hypothetical protein
LSKILFYGLMGEMTVCHHKEVLMKRSLRWGCTIGGFLGCVFIAGTAGAQSAGPGGAGGGSGGSQAVQEQMYQERMKEFFSEQDQGGQQSQGMQRQTGMKGDEESSQKMQSDQRQSGKSTGDHTIDDKGKTKK